MVERTEGIILRTRPLTETSLIVHWLTRDSGRVQTVAKGARRAKSPFLGKLDLFYEADLSFQRSRRSELHVLREVSVREYRPALRRDLGCLQQAAYFTQLIELMTETETPIPGVFRLAREALETLLLSGPQPLRVFAFEAKLLHELGLDPNSQPRHLTPGARELLRQMTLPDGATLAQLRLTPAQRNEIGDLLHESIGANAGRVPPGRTAALQS